MKKKYLGLIITIVAIIGFVAVLLSFDNEIFSTHIGDEIVENVEYPPDDFEGKENRFVGTWKVTYEDSDTLESELIINNNGTYTMKKTNPYGTSNDSGRWKEWSDNWEHKSYISFTFAPNNYNFKRHYEIKIFSWDSFTLDFKEEENEKNKPDIFPKHWILERV